MRESGTIACCDKIVDRAVFLDISFSDFAYAVSGTKVSLYYMQERGCYFLLAISLQIG